MNQPTGIIGAMDEEIALLLERMEDSGSAVKAGITYYTGRLLGKPVVVCKSGVGKVNAAVTTQILLDTFGVNRVLFTGVAGALHPELEIGDIVISESCMQHDMDVTPLGYPKGVIPYQETSVFKADPPLTALAEEACRALNCRYVTGLVLSGDQFIASGEAVLQLREELGGACAEMEGAAVGQVCFMNGVPFVIIRSMSDKADGSAHLNYRDFTETAARNSCAILEYMLQAL
ncbi:5'-methylthioadenosine/adenosylhomocysteine nucleosidase [Paenibacillus tengchongensis]|uniref:5'-methylthioadenosine/adenosylhomocysteine nucleosidase n=1 Tax=Paenibacillus tengchongensis TaxID=2608684 RepID=UPI00124F423D|nr:5'-methylthioadenosine/adenosylhomocysteine nucleosidase [Paenibacillus tengchongensis]